MSLFGGRSTAQTFEFESDVLQRLGAALDASGVLSSANLSVVPQALQRGAGCLDGEISIRIDGQEQRYAVEVKSRVARTLDLERVIAQLGSLDNGLLVVPHLSRGMAEVCVRAGVQFIDLTGNLHLRGWNYHFIVIGRSADNDAILPIPEAAVGRASVTPTGLRVLFTLLINREARSLSQRDLATMAGVANGAVGPALHDLEQRGYLATGVEGRKRVLLNVESVVDEWVSLYPLRLRPKLNARRFSAADPEWWRNMTPTRSSSTEAETRTWWSGEVAAALLTKDLRPETQTLYVTPENRSTALAHVIKAGRLRADSVGDITILDSFWDPERQGPEDGIVPLLLVYADLMDTREPRNLAVARQLRSLVLESL
ncbi:type IV toxin-antitoxin system AbiEi family antitoxin [Robbsia andropogonis]|uniref:type IV toxin-antitoxin system AbiEi family antitoxin n=1 Tax=Robbsia andropogonis TaxID=28092 RepID=UPI002A6B8BB4|nr:type IV toxin-antitoxin system AbiEi family antitoxin [Robbsia andropogonis]